jgi:hypothetical protein
MKRYEASSTQYKKILQIKPNDHNALDNLEEIEKLKRGIS